MFQYINVLFKNDEYEKTFLPFIANNNIFL